MANKKGHGNASAPDENVPGEGDFPAVSPRDLHPTSDIRFVMVEVSKLTTKVERLISDVEKIDDQLDKLRHVYSRIQGFIIAAIVLVPICAGLVWWLIGGELTGIRNALQHLPPAKP